MTDMVFPRDDEPFVTPDTGPRDPVIDVPGDELLGVPTDPPVPVPSDVPFDPPGEVPSTDDRDGVPMERPPDHPADQPVAPVTVAQQGGMVMRRGKRDQWSPVR